MSEKGQINSISFYGTDGKRVKSINLLHGHNEIQGEHTHVGYYHAEGGTRQLTAAEEKMVEYVKKAWYTKKVGSRLDATLFYRNPGWSPGTCCFSKLSYKWRILR